MDTEKTDVGAGKSSPPTAGSAEIDERFRTAMRILDEAAKVPKDGQPHPFRCPLCGDQAVGCVDPGNDHTIAVCKCTPWAHRTWSQNVTDEGRGLPRPSPSDCSMGGPQ